MPNRNVLFKTAMIIFLIMIYSCKKDYVQIDNLPRKELSFDELPSEVMQVYIEVARIVNRNDTVINLNKKGQVNMKNTSLVDSHLELIQEGFNHIFIMDSIKLKLKANKGDPFVFYDKSLFYTEELNLTEYNYNKSMYYEIDLDSLLNNPKIK